MTYGAFPEDFASYELGVRPRKPIPQAALCAVALTLSTSVGLWALYAGPVSTASNVATPQVAAPVAAPNRPAPVAIAAAPKVSPSAKVAVPLRAAKSPVREAAQVVAGLELSLLSPALTKNNAGVTFAQSAPVRTAFEPRVLPQPVAPAQVAVATPAPAPQPVAVANVAPPAPEAPVEAEVSETPAPTAKDIPLPLRRPASLAMTNDRVAPRDNARPIVQAKVDPSQVVAPQPAPAGPGFFEKMFGGTRPSGTALAYAAPDDGGIGNIFNGATRRPAAYDRYTAVYDITAHVVHMPDGTRLEAHSGLGPYKDNPAGVAMRMVGATPPNLYQLTFREAPFHGVRALRLTPLGGTTFGRAGLLAHTYMLRGRPPGESNGCVVFADYDRFLRAFENGSIRRLAVVARM